jgi:hypothetical protein
VRGALVSNVAGESRSPSADVPTAGGTLGNVVPITAAEKRRVAESQVPIVSATAAERYGSIYGDDNMRGLGWQEGDLPSRCR